MKKTKIKVESIEVMAITCPACLDTIYSRAGHDYRSCSCGKYSIDGGFNYIRTAWDPKLPVPVAKKIQVQATKGELYDDWNYRKNKFGLIKNEKRPKTTNS